MAYVTIARVTLGPSDCSPALVRFAAVALSSRERRSGVFLGRWGLLLGLLRAASCVLGTKSRFPPSFSWSCASPVPVNEALAHLKRRNPMILMITQQAARLLAPQDANRAMHQSSYNDAPNKSTANGASLRPVGDCCCPKETVLRSR